MESAAAAAVQPLCACVCIHRCPCGAPCARCFPAPREEQTALSSVPMDAPSDAPTNAAAANSSNSGEAVAVPPAPLSRTLAVHELSWQEQLFRRQFAGESIRLRLEHLVASGGVPRALSLYLAYFHFRTRGYVLHDGFTLGVDYVVYPIGGADKWHAQFAVLVGDVEPLAPSPLNQPLSSAANATFQYAMRTMYIGVKQKKSCLYVRVFARAEESSIVSAASADSSPSASEPAAHDLARYSVYVHRLTPWFASKGREYTPTTNGDTQSAQPKNKQNGKQSKQLNKNNQAHSKPTSTQQQPSKRQKTEPTG